jgi:hypothetical protein
MFCTGQDPRYELRFPITTTEVLVLLGSSADVCYIFADRSTLFIYAFFWHSEGRASWYILIMKANEMHYFSDVFDKVICLFRTGPLSIIRNISTLYTRSSYLSCKFCWRLLAWSRWSSILTMLADTSRTSMANTYCVHTVLRYSWWWTVDLSETRTVLYQINLRNSASRWLSL